MTITTFNPAIITKNAEETIALFEALGFERRHMKTGINDQDITLIRINVRNFDEAYKMLEEKGFKNAQGGKIMDAGSSKIAMMVAPSGFLISIAEHFRKEEKKQARKWMVKTAKCEPIPGPIIYRDGPVAFF